MGYTPPYLDVRLVSGIWCIRPPGIAGEYVRIFPNMQENYPQIMLAGNDNFNIIVPATKKLVLQDHVIGEFCNIGYATPDVSINPLINKNIFLNPTGTGVVKFGAYTAGAATDSTGYITILDAAGNTRKLMVQA